MTLEFPSSELKIDIFYFGTSGHDPWIRDGPEKFGTLGIFETSFQFFQFFVFISTSK